MSFKNNLVLITGTPFLPVDVPLDDGSTVVVDFDHVQLGLSRTLQQYRESSKFAAFMTALLEESNKLEAAYQQLLGLTNVDLMTGVNLDTIGIIVGVSRQVGSVVTLNWFGFEDTGSWATPFGEEGVPNIGARFFEEGEVLSSTSVLQDVEYRLLIKAKIVKNNSSCTPEDIIQGLRIIFGVPDIKLTENHLSLSIAIGRPIYAFEKAIITALDILPRPAGIPIVGDIDTFVPPGAGYTGGTEGENF